MLSDEVQRYEALTGESATEIPISRIGGYLDGYERGRIDAIEEIKKKIDETTWYHISNGKLVKGANLAHEPLYRYSDIEKLFEELKEAEE